MPTQSGVAPGCRDAAIAYYLKRWKSEEFRTDRSVRFFWELARSSLTPRCSTNSQQVVVVDVGANVGEQLSYWEREFLNISSCGATASRLILVEPNPQNLAALRPRVAAWRARPHNNGDGRLDRKGGDGDGAAGGHSSHRRTPVRSGDVIIVDSAASYHDGEVTFAVSKRNYGGADKGNERGSLFAKGLIAGDARTALVRTRAQTLASVFSDLRRAGELRPLANVTIPLLKIDAEGYDAAVLYGAAELLPRTNVIVFECHKLWRDAGFSFRAAVEFLSRFGFDSFKLGLFYWVPVTPPAYWDDRYEHTLQWSNCVAVRRGHPFAHMFSLPPPCE